MDPADIRALRLLARAAKAEVSSRELGPGLPSGWQGALVVHSSKLVLLGKELGLELGHVDTGSGHFNICILKKL